MANRLNGTGALNYQGVNAPTPPNLITMDRRPTVTDGVGMPLGTLWLIPQAAAGIKPQKEIWVLVGNRQNVFIWKHLRGSTGPTPVPFGVIRTVYDTPGSYTYTPTDGMINVLVECVGGGGSSGTYKDNAGLGTASLNPGGAGGAYSSRLLTAAEIGDSESFIVGAGGAAGTIGVGFTAGNNGENSAFGPFALYADAGGGQGAQGSIVFATGGVAANGDINIDGSSPVSVITSNGAGGLFTGGGTGGSSGMSFGFGGGFTQAPGTAKSGTGYGSGAGGFTMPNSNGGDEVAGSAGQNGVVIITEYF